MLSGDGVVPEAPCRQPRPARDLRRLHEPRQGGSDVAQREQDGVPGRKGEERQRRRLRLERDRSAHGRGGVGREIEDYGVEVGTGYPVHHGVVHFRDEGPAAAFEAPHEPALPQRVVAIEAVRHHAGHQSAELRVAARRRQRRLADVEAEVEVRIVDPERCPQAKRDRPQLPPVSRHEREARPDGRADLVVRRRRTLEDGDRGDGHRQMPVLVLGVEETGVERAQLLHGRLPARDRSAVDEHRRRSPEPMHLSSQTRGTSPLILDVHLATQQGRRS